MSLDAIPKGGGFADGLAFLSNKQNVIDSAARARAWVKVALRAVREARDPNPWRLSDNEAIAGYLLEQIAIWEREQVNV
jgi:hypothetical protein